MAKRRSGSRTTRRKTPKSRKTSKSSRTRTSGRKRSRNDSRTAGVLNRLRGLKSELIGLVLAGLGLLALLGMLSPRTSTLSGALLDVVWQVFGWGGIVVPFLLLAGGFVLLLRAFEDRLPIPQPEKLFGLGLLFVAALILLHAFTGATTFAEGIQVAREGRGGGLVGGALLALLVGALGFGGMIVALLVLLVISFTLMAGLSAAELALLGFQATRGMTRRLWASVRATLTDLSPGARRAQRRATFEPAVLPDLSEGPTAPPLTPDPAGAPGEPAPAPVSLWELPEFTGLLEPGDEESTDEAFDRERGRLIEETLLAFGAPAHVVEINRGPTITQFGVEPDYVESRGGRRIKVKVSKIASLADDLALALAAPSIRIQAPVPGKGFVGVEVPNLDVTMVALRDVMESEGFNAINSRLRIGLGRDVSGLPIGADLSAMPHLLIAGTTGSGKSVCINAIIACLLLQNTPDDLKLVLVDPKRVELTFYHGIPHLLAPVVVELERVVPALQWVSREMDERYRRFSKEGARNILDYNERMRLTNRATLPYLVVVIDELADLMMLAPYETERAVTRLAQLSRATGIHLVIATQRPSVDVVTGLIKANFPARIAFAVASSVDSRVILDQPGAERLLGQGDMLFQAPDASAPVRMQGVFVSEPELHRVIRYWKNAALGGEGTRPSASAPGETLPSGADLKQAPLWEEIEAAAKDRDELYDEAVEIVREMRRASISLLQRRLRIGYTRAARLIDQLEDDGIVGPEPGGSQAREVLDYGDFAPVEGE